MQGKTAAHHTGAIWYPTRLIQTAQKSLYVMEDSAMLFVGRDVIRDAA